MEPLQGDEQVLHNLQMQVDMVQQVKHYLFFASHSQSLVHFSYKYSTIFLIDFDTLIYQ